MKIEIVKEIRFAVVMYGGVSLAIYINGVAQELLQMVRATAVNTETDEFQFEESELEGSGNSYRMLSYLLGDQELMKEFAHQVKDKGSWESVQKELQTKVNKQSSVKVVRFVVDILSGSSAGGINAIYLSKALVSGQNIKKLEDLWVNEGKFSALLNDDNSVQGTKLNPSKEPASLFNSQRMYLKLLEAFEQMDNEKNPINLSMIDEVDLFVTLTDFWGLPIPVRLFDKIIHERNHRRRLHFKYRRDGVNNFQKENYPFLAYAARCTSSFPVVFDPMKLSDTAAVLNTKEPKTEMPQNWESYFPQERIQQDKSPIDWENRVFVDGGTLDNKPFGYAIEALAQRQANVLIDRKLIYIEPKPDLDGGNKRIGWTHRPDALKNTINIVSSLPGYETIREDLQQVLERNRLIGRVNYIVSNARKDEYQLLDLVKNDLKEIVGENSPLAAPRLNKKWAELTLAELARDKGQAVYSYYRLRMSALTDDLARLSTRRAGFDDTSDYFLAIRSLVRAWRLKSYNKDEDKQSENTISTFLYEYDFNYRLRRLRFVLQEADRILSAMDKLKDKSFADLTDEEFQKDKFAADLKLRCNLTRKFKEHDSFQTALGLKNAKEILQQKFPLVENGLFEPLSKSPDEKIFSADKDELRLILRKFKKSLNHYLKELDRRQQFIETRSVDEDLPEQFKELNDKFSAVAKIISVEDLGKLLGETEGQNAIADYDLETSNKQVKEFFEKRTDIRDGIDKIAEVLRRIYNGGRGNTDEKQSLFGKVRRESEKLFAPKNANTTSLENAVSDYLWHFYKNFDSYDQIIFPITFETPIGEGDMVEVARISPADAVNLINEETDSLQRKKLAGDTFFSFSAFFNEDWRRNDIMWGRLDAVERLFELVSSGGDLGNAPRFKETIITEIQRSVLKDNRSLLGGDENDNQFNYVEFIKNQYKVNRSLDENLIMKTTARALAVAAKVLRSPTENPKNEDGSPKTNTPNNWLVKLAVVIDSLRRLVEISSYKFSLANCFSFLTMPFRMEWLSILFLILLSSLFGFWLAIFKVLHLSGGWVFILKYLKDFGISETAFLWVGGVICVFGSFYLLLFVLTYWLKSFISRRLTKEIIGE